VPPQTTCHAYETLLLVMADASACRIGHDSQRTGWHPASRERFAGLRPPLTPAASSNTTESTHSKFKRGRKQDHRQVGLRAGLRE